MVQSVKMYLDEEMYMICRDTIGTVTITLSNSFRTYNAGYNVSPLFMLGDALSILEHIPDASIDFCMTSPPYWNKRQYHNGGIGLEESYKDYITHLLQIFVQIKRVLKPQGSFWLVLGDSYLNKLLVGIPWRIAFSLMDEQGWILRNSVVWNKVKGGLDNT